MPDFGPHLGTDAARACPGSPLNPQAPGNWYCLRVLANADFKVEEILIKYGVHAFAPFYREKTQWSDRTAEVARPLFPGYVLVLFDPDAPSIYGEPGATALHDILRFAGVCNFLPSNELPAIVPIEQIEDIGRVLLSRMDAKPCEFVAGDKITVDTGPLAGVSGVVVRSKSSPDQYRLVVQVEILRRAVSVELDAATVKRLEKVAGKNAA